MYAGGARLDDTGEADGWASEDDDGGGGTWLVDGPGPCEEWGGGGGPEGPWLPE